jgi:hypothetical protein
VVWSFGFALLAAVVAQRQVPYTELFLDPNHLGQIPWYFGFVSNLGILGWTTATATAAFGAWVAAYGGRPAAARMLGGGAALSALLLADDLFQLHMLVRPLLGLPKTAAYGFYLVAASLWLTTQFREIRRTRVELLLAAGFGLGLSVVFDQIRRVVPSLDPDTSLLIEDSAKFLGVLAWAQYFTLTSSDIVRSIVTGLRHRTQAAPAPKVASPSELVQNPT